MNLIFALPAACFAESREELSLTESFKKSAAVPAASDAEEIIVKADKLYYDTTAGDVYAEKNVVATDGSAIITTHELYGNGQKNEVWADGRVNFKQDVVNMTGTNFYYNFLQKSGSMKQVYGRMNQSFLYADDIEFYPQHLVAYNAVSTTCPAFEPDFHYSAKKVEMWPGDHATYYGFTYWIKNNKIFSIDEYQTSLKDKEKGGFDMPTIGWDNDAKWWIQYDLKTEVAPNIQAFANLWFSTQYDDRSQFGLQYYNPHIDVALNYYIVGWNRDSNYNWVKKQNDSRVNMGWHPLYKNSVWSWNFVTEYGKWTDNLKSSWHQIYQLNFTRQLIRLTDKDTFSNNLSYSLTKDNIHYLNSAAGQNGTSSNTSFSWTGTAEHTFNKKFSMLASYIYTGNFNQQTFAYNAGNLAQEGDLGFTYKFSDKTQLTFLWRFDATGSSGTYSYDFAITQDLHDWLLYFWVRQPVGAGAKRIYSWNLTTIRW